MNTSISNITVSDTYWKAILLSSEQVSTLIADDGSYTRKNI